MKRILVTGRNDRFPVVTELRSRGLTTRGHMAPSVSAMLSEGAYPIPGMRPESAAGGTRAPSTPLQVAPSCVPYPPSLGVIIAEAVLYGVVFFGAGFGLAWSFPA